MLLSISYHNMGVEEEFLHNLENSINWYERSCQVLTENGITEAKLNNKFICDLNKAKEVNSNIVRYHYNSFNIETDG